MGSTPISRRHARVWHRFIAILVACVLFYQPYAWRVSFWKCVLSYSDNPKVIFLLGTFVVQSLAFILPNLLMLFIYKVQWPYFEQFKIQRKEWPWLSPKQEERQKFSELLKKTIPQVLFNQFILANILAFFSYDQFTALGMNADLEKVPAWYETLFQVIAFMLIEDTLFYWGHRFLHIPKLYPYIHKQHHQYVTTIGIAAEYTHPIEFIFTNALPFTAGPALFGAHYLTFWIWSIWRYGETLDGHSGYEFPWAPYRLLPFSGSATYHDFHHAHQVANYSSFFSYWDTINGTNSAFYEYLQKEEQIMKNLDEQENKKKK